MNDQLHLDGEDWEHRLQQALADMPSERAPAGLRRRLRNIPRRQGRARRPLWLHPGRGLALALIPLLLVGLLLQEQRQQRELEQELARAQRDLAQALRYLEQANERAGASVLQAVERGVGQPVGRKTYAVLQEHLDLTQEL